MLRDRGTKKWTSIFLPEQVEGIRRLVKELHKVKKPELDEQEWEVIEQNVCDAMAENRTLSFTYWVDGRFETVVGCVHYIDLHRKQFRIIDEFEEKHYIAFEDVIGVTFG